MSFWAKGSMYTLNWCLRAKHADETSFASVSDAVTGGRYPLERSPVPRYASIATSEDERASECARGWSYDIDPPSSGCAGNRSASVDDSCECKRTTKLAAQRLRERNCDRRCAYALLRLVDASNEPGHPAAVEATKTQRLIPVARSSCSALRAC